MPLSAWLFSFASAIGFVMGSLAPQIVRHAGHSIEAAIHRAKHEHQSHVAR